MAVREELGHLTTQLADVNVPQALYAQCEKVGLAA